MAISAPKWLMRPKSLFMSVVKITRSKSISGPIDRHAKLSDGQRCYDLAIAEENVAGELMDLAAAGSLPEDWDAIETAGEIPDRYRQLWSQLTGEEVLGPGSAGSNRINVPGECSLTL